MWLAALFTIEPTIELTIEPNIRLRGDTTHADAT
jgi:hypothetical protein